MKRHASGNWRTPPPLLTGCLVTNAPIQAVLAG